MPFIQLPTHQVHYEVIGRANCPWLTFSHALGADLHLWDAQIAAFADSFQILRYDTRGHGRSQVLPKPSAVADLGFDVLALWDALGITKSHFCGISMGGLLGQWLALHAPERIDRLVICAAGQKFGTAQSWQERMARLRTDGLIPEVSDIIERWFSAPFRQQQPDLVERIAQTIRHTSLDGYLSCCHAVAGADFRQGLERVPHPVLAVAGISDPTSSPDQARRLAETVPHGTWAAIPGNHLCPVESPSEFQRAVKTFLRPSSAGPAVG